MLPTIDENSIHMHTFKYIMKRGRGGWVSNWSQSRIRTGVLPPGSSHLNINPGTMSTKVRNDLIG